MRVGDARSCSLVPADAPARFTSPPWYPDCSFGTGTPPACHRLLRKRPLRTASRIMLKVIFLHLSAVRAHPGIRNEPGILLFCTKNYRKKKQKSKSWPGSWSGKLWQTAGKRRNLLIMRIMIARIIAYISAWAASFSTQSPCYPTRARTRTSLTSRISPAPAGSPRALKRAWPRPPG